MPSYTVYVYPVMTMRVPNIEADTPADACAKAMRVAVGRLFAAEQALEQLNLWYAEDIKEFLVDRDDDPEHLNSVWCDTEYQVQSK